MPAGPRLVGVGVGPERSRPRHRAGARHAARRRPGLRGRRPAPDAIGRAEMVVRGRRARGARSTAGPRHRGDDEATTRPRRRPPTASLVASLDRGERRRLRRRSATRTCTPSFPALARRGRAPRARACRSRRCPGSWRSRSSPPATGHGARRRRRAQHRRWSSSATSSGGATGAARRRRPHGRPLQGRAPPPELAARARPRGRLDGAVVGELLGLPGGRAEPVADVGRPPGPYLATVVVPRGATPDRRRSTGRDLVRRRRSRRGRPHHPARRDRLGAADVVVWAASLVLAGGARALPAEASSSTTPRP